MDIFIIICLIGLSLYLAYKYTQLQKQQSSYKELQTDIQNANSILDDIKAQTKTATEELQDIQQSQTSHQFELVALLAKEDELRKNIDSNQAIVASQTEIINNYREQYSALKDEQDKKCLQIIQDTSLKINQIEASYKLTIEQKEQETKAIIEQLAANLEEERQKYLSIIETVQNAQTEDEKDANRHIKIRDATKDDINYLLNNVANKLSNPDILYKLIWSEYIQKPTNEMLDFILPQRDCPGIYKITNDKNKKAYIGRSTSVRKRLTDHIKSAVGISTIADQRVHQAMREEGLWNFTFELIEECDKDKLNEREKFYIQFFSTEQLGYNQKAGG